MYVSSTHISSLCDTGLLLYREIILLCLRFLSAQALVSHSCLHVLNLQLRQESDITHRSTEKHLMYKIIYCRC